MEQNKDTFLKNQMPEKKENEGLAHKVGDAIERAGDKLTEKGYNNAGERVHNLGDKIEHMNDEKDTSRDM